MLNLSSPLPRRCDGLSRRSLLKAGSLGLAGVNLGLADLLRARAIAAENGRTGPADRSVILVWLDGGPPQHETYDPKPQAPGEFRGPLKAMSTKVPGILVSELLPYHARLMDKMSIIRSMHHDNGDHYAAAHWMLTGYLGSNASSLPLSTRRQAPSFPGSPEPEAGDAGVCRLAPHAFGGTRSRVSRRGISRCRLQSVRR